MKKQHTIRELKAAIGKNYKAIAALMDRLDELQTKRVLPGLKRKYQGRYFKYDNGYSSENRWPVYSYCREVMSEHRASCVSFENDPMRGWTFDISKETDLFLFQTEITREEFDQAAREMVSFATSIVDYD
jgi:hypothetical protein